jgi:hypothetical protein
VWSVMIGTTSAKLSLRVRVAVQFATLCPFVLERNVNLGKLILDM